MKSMKALSQRRCSEVTGRMMPRMAAQLQERSGHEQLCDRRLSGRAASLMPHRLEVIPMQGTKYRAEFETRPDHNTADFTDYRGDIAIGHEYAIEADEGRLWRIAELRPEASGIETIVFTSADRD
jgi:hypothetical protein